MDAAVIGSNWIISSQFFGMNCNGRSKFLFRSLLQFGPFVRDDRAFNRTYLQANSAVYTSIKINPVPISTLGIFAGTGVNASYRTSTDAISNPFTSIRNNSMSHDSILDFGFWIFD
jgi:hypothetical protein